MNRPTIWPWRKRRGPTTAARRNKPSSHVNLHLEILEDRVLLSTTLVNSTVDYEQWRQQSFHLDDMAVAGSTPAVGTVGSQAMQGTSLIGLDKVFADYGYRGDGYSVAVIDTGIDYNNAALGGGWGNRVIAGWNFVSNNGNPMDDNGHGTHVAGIIGSSDANYTGVAPNVNLIALKVLDANGSGTFGAVEDALKWVAANQSKYNIVAVNLSLGAGSFTVNPYAFLDDEFATLKSEGVFIAAAAGNDYYANQNPPGLAFPGIDPYVVSVGAVWTGNYGTVQWFGGGVDYNTAPDHIASFSQRGPSLDLLAPGTMITSTYKGGGFQTLSGTSMATPFVAGAAVLLHQRLDAVGQHANANEDYILSLMQSTGATIHDGEYGYDNVNNTGLDFKRLDLAAAMKAIKNNVNTAPTLDAIADRSVQKNQSLPITLVAADADKDPLAFSAQAYANSSQQSPAPVALSINGNQLLLTPTTGYTGTFFVVVTVSDGKATASRSFQVTVSNSTPILDPIPDQAASLNKPLTVQLSAKDADGDALTYTAQVQPVPTQAYQLKQQLGLSYAGSYYTNSFRANEKWLRGSNNTWYIILPSGELRKWLGTLGASMAAGALVTTLDKSFYDDPSLLWNAQPTIPATVTFSGNKMTITPLAGFTGSFTVQVTASDGVASATRTFTVNVTQYSPPTLAAIPDQTIKAGQSALAVNLAVANPGGLPLTYSAQVQGGDSQAYQIKQNLGLTSSPSSYTNALGLKEKWILGSNYQWYILLPNGELRKWSNTVKATMAATALIATLDVSYYQDPSKLYNAQPGAGATVTVSGGQLVIRPVAGFKGSFTVTVTVTDGTTTLTRTFQVTVTA